MSINVRIGAEWIDRFHHPASLGCEQPDLHYSSNTAEGFLHRMGASGHTQIFDWGNDNAWQSDFDHPDFGGDSLNWSDNVHFCYFGGHGGQFHFDGKPVMTIGFSSNHAGPGLAPCFSMSAQWRLGVRSLKWLVLDSCVTVKDTDPNHIVDVWGSPMQGIHLVFGFINIQMVGPTTAARRTLFASTICSDKALANAWLDTGYVWDKSQPSRPIAIAAGVSRDDAINRRENETLSWRDANVASTNWLAWKWRG